MSPRHIRGPLAAAAVLAAAALPGCGIGPGESSHGEATLIVTRDYGSEDLLAAALEDPPQSATVIRFLDSEAEIETRYGGGFVQSIEGVEGEIDDGRSLDWFFFVNGLEADRGAAEVEVRAGDRIWWDHRDWTDALRTPAVVGSWPEPFAQTAAGAERLPVRVECFAARGPCDAVSERLAEEGVDTSIERAGAGGPPALRLLVGPWGALHRDETASLLAEGPATSGVFARFVRRGERWGLALLDERARQVGELRARSGLVAGLRRGDRPAVWLVTGTDAEGVEQALTMLEHRDLDQRYAVAGIGSRTVPLPAEAAP